MAWHRPGDKPLSEPMMGNLRMYTSLGLIEFIYRRQAIIWINDD